MIGAARAASTRQYQLLGTTTITSTGSQSATIPAGTVYIEIEMHGSGGGGGGRIAVGSGRSVTYYGQGGGAGGAYLSKRYQVSDMQASDVLNFYVGEGGDAGEPRASTDGDYPDACHGGHGESTKLITHTRGVSTITTFDGVESGGGDGATASLFSATFSGATANGGDTMITGGSSIASGGAGGNGGAGGTGASGGRGGLGGGAGEQAEDGVVPGGGGGGARGIEVISYHNFGATGANGKVVVRSFG